MAELNDLVQGEVQRLMATSKEYRNKIDNAKTKTKKNWYLKKLKKNNAKLMNVLIALEKVKNAKKTSNESK